MWGSSYRVPTTTSWVARSTWMNRRLLNLHPGADLPTIREHLEALERICAGGENSGPIGQLPKRNRFHWLVAPRSTMIQTSPVHTGQCTDPAHVVEHLAKKMVLLE